MSIFFIVILILFGLSLVVLELIIVPGLIVGLAGGLFLLIAILWSWQIYGSTAGLITSVIVITLLVVSIYSALKSNFWKRFSLKNKIDGKMNVIEAGEISIGDIGNAVSSLRPMGTVRINGKHYEAICEGQVIPPNFPIIVTRVEQNKLIVKPRN
jgi:membrane-bound ClpP family serine protease